MKISTVKKTAAALLLAGTFALSSPLQIFANDATVRSYEDQLASLSERQKNALDQLNKAESSLSGALERKQIIDDYLEATMKKIVVAEAMLDELELSISEKEKAVKNAEADIESKRAAFLDRMVYMEEDGKASFLEILLGAESLGDFLAKLDSINSIMEYDKQVTESLNAAKDELEKSVTALEKAREEQLEVISLLEKDKESFETLSAESTEVVAQLQGNTQALRDEYDRASAEEKALAAELEAYLKELEAQKRPESSPNDAPEYPSGDGNFIPPLDPSCGAYISSSYGWRDLFGVPDLHEATDIPATAGTPIYASNSGVVIRSEKHYSYGNYIMIDHGNGIYTLYAHMTYREFSVGQSVSKGEVIGYVGNTGNSYGAHLHFEYWVDGKRTDPELYVSLPYPKY